METNSTEDPKYFEELYPQIEEAYNDDRILESIKIVKEIGNYTLTIT